MGVPYILEFSVDCQGHNRLVDCAGFVVIFFTFKLCIKIWC